MLKYIRPLCVCSFVCDGIDGWFARKLNQGITTLLTSSSREWFVLDVMWQLNVVVMWKDREITVFSVISTKWWEYLLTNLMVMLILF